MAIRGQGPFFFPPNLAKPPQTPPGGGAGGGGGLGGKGGNISTPGGQGLPTGAHQLVAHQNALAQATPEVHLERAKANTEAMKAAHTVIKHQTGMQASAAKHQQTLQAQGLQHLSQYFMNQAPRGVDPTGYARSMVGQMTNYGRPLTAPRGVSQAGYNRELMYPRARYSTGGWDSGHGVGGSFGGGFAGGGGGSAPPGSGVGQDPTRYHYGSGSGAGTPGGGALPYNPDNPVVIQTVPPAGGPPNSGWAGDYSGGSEGSFYAPAPGGPMDVRYTPGSPGGSYGYYPTLTGTSAWESPSPWNSSGAPQVPNPFGSSLGGPSNWGYGAIPGSTPESVMAGEAYSGFSSGWLSPAYIGSGDGSSDGSGSLY